MASVDSPPSLIENKEVEALILNQSCVKDEDEDEEGGGGGGEEEEEGEDEIDHFTGLSGDFLERDEEEEKLMEAFPSEDTAPHPTLADNIVVTQIRQTRLFDMYKSLGKSLKKYRDGKLPKAFEYIPYMEYWEDVLLLTEPEHWSPNAMYEVTRIFVSQSDLGVFESFNRLVLLPYIRSDIRKNKRLHFVLHLALNKTLEIKPAAFFNGILFPLCDSRTCTLREAVLIGSTLRKVLISPPHPSVALLKLAEMEYYDSTSYFIKLLLEEANDLPYGAIEALVSHFMRFSENTGTMPVIWHQSLLAFVQRYKNKLHEADKENLRLVLGKQNHKLVTPKIRKELNGSCDLDEEDD